MGSPQCGTVARNDDMDARDRAAVGHPASGRQAVGAGITQIIAKVMKGVAPGQDVRKKEREITARTDSGGLEASQHADTT